MPEITNKKEPEVVIELSFKVQMRDYKLRLATKRAWLIAVFLVIIRGVSYFLRGSP